MIRKSLVFLSVGLIAATTVYAADEDGDSILGLKSSN